MYYFSVGVTGKLHLDSGSVRHMRLLPLWICFTRWLGWQSTVNIQISWCAKSELNFLCVSIWMISKYINHHAMLWLFYQHGQFLLTLRITWFGDRMCKEWTKFLVNGLCVSIWVISKYINHHAWLWFYCQYEQFLMTGRITCLEFKCAKDEQVFLSVCTFVAPTAPELATCYWKRLWWRLRFTRKCKYYINYNYICFWNVEKCRFI